MVSPIRSPSSNVSLRRKQLRDQLTISKYNPPSCLFTPLSPITTTTKSRSSSSQHHYHEQQQQDQQQQRTSSSTLYVVSNNVTTTSTLKSKLDSDNEGEIILLQDDDDYDDDDDDDDDTTSDDDDDDDPNSDDEFATDNGPDNNNDTAEYRRIRIPIDPTESTTKRNNNNNNNNNCLSLRRRQGTNSYNNVILDDPKAATPLLHIIPTTPTTPKTLSSIPRNSLGSSLHRSTLASSSSSGHSKKKGTVVSNNKNSNSNSNNIDNGVEFVPNEEQELKLLNLLCSNDIDPKTKSTTSLITPTTTKKGVIPSTPLSSRRRRHQQKQQQPNHPMVLYGDVQTTTSSTSSATRSNSSQDVSLIPPDPILTILSDDFDDDDDDNDNTTTKRITYNCFDTPEDRSDRPRLCSSKLLPTKLFLGMDDLDYDDDDDDDDDDDNNTNTAIGDTNDHSNSNTNDDTNSGGGGAIEFESPRSTTSSVASSLACVIPGSGTTSTKGQLTIHEEDNEDTTDDGTAVSGSSGTIASLGCILPGSFHRNNGGSNSNHNSSSHSSNIRRNRSIAITPNNHHHYDQTGSTSKYDVEKKGVEGGEKERVPTTPTNTTIRRTISWTSPCKQGNNNNSQSPGGKFLLLDSNRIRSHSNSNRTSTFTSKNINNNGLNQKKDTPTKNQMNRPSYVAPQSLIPNIVAQEKKDKDCRTTTPQKARKDNNGIVVDVVIPSTTSKRIGTSGSGTNSVVSSKTSSYSTNRRKVGAVEIAAVVTPTSPRIRSYDLSDIDNKNDCNGSNSSTSKLNDTINNNSNKPYLNNVFVPIKDPNQTNNKNYESSNVEDDEIPNTTSYDEDNDDDNDDDNDSVEMIVHKQQQQHNGDAGIANSKLKKQGSIGKRMWDSLVTKLSKRKLLAGTASSNNSLSGRALSSASSSSSLGLKHVTFGMESENRVQYFTPYFVVDVPQSDLWWTRDELAVGRNETKRIAVMATKLGSCPTRMGTSQRHEQEVGNYSTAYAEAYFQVLTEKRLSLEKKDALVRGLQQGFRGYEMFNPAVCLRRRDHVQETVRSIVKYYHNANQQIYHQQQRYGFTTSSSHHQPSRRSRSSSAYLTEQFLGQSNHHVMEDDTMTMATANTPEELLLALQQKARMEVERYDVTCKLVRTHSQLLSAGCRSWAQAIAVAERCAVQQDEDDNDDDTTDFLRLLEATITTPASTPKRYSFVGKSSSNHSSTTNTPKNSILKTSAHNKKSKGKKKTILSTMMTRSNSTGQFKPNNNMNNNSMRSGSSSTHTSTTTTTDRMSSSSTRNLQLHYAHEDKDADAIGGCSNNDKIAQRTTMNNNSRTDRKNSKSSNASTSSNTTTSRKNTDDGDNKYHYRQPTTPTTPRSIDRRRTEFLQKVIEPVPHQHPYQPQAHSNSQLTL